MQAGFAMLETGFVPFSANRNILFKVRGCSGGWSECDLTKRTMIGK